MSKEKDYLPEGISEEKFVEIVNKVCYKSALKFKFGYHDIEDMKQKSMQLAITFLQNGKFKPRGEKPMEQQLSNFLRVWIHNRLNNYRRDNCCRYPNNGGANQTKFNLQYALPIGAMGLTNSEMFARESDLVNKASLNEIVERITSRLYKKNLDRYYKYLEDPSSLTDEETAKLFKAIKRILGGTPEEYI